MNVTITDVLTSNSVHLDLTLFNSFLNNTQEITNSYHV